MADNTLDNIGNPQLQNVDMESKLSSLLDASRIKTAELKAKHTTAIMEQKLRDQAALESQSAWVGKLGLEPGSFLGNRVNDVASLASGTGRLVGQIASLPLSGAGAMMTGPAEQEDYAAYNRKMNGTATEADIARLDTPFTETSSKTRLSLFNEAEDMRRKARGVNDFTDITKIVDQTNRNALAADLGSDFKSNWDKVTGSWDEAKHGELMKGSGHLISGLAGLVFNAGEAAVTNPSAAREYIVENAPQLFLGAAGRLGAAGMAASNAGYAADYYQQGIEAYQAKHGMELPDAEQRRHMAVMASSLAIAEHAGDHLGLAAAKLGTRSTEAVAEGGIKGTLKAFAQGFTTEALTEGYQTYAENDITGKGSTPLDIYQGAVIGGIAGAGLSGGAHAVAHVTGNTESQQAVKAADAETFQSSAESNDPSAYLDKASPKYDPAKAIGVLLAHAQKEDTAPETKQANLEKAGSIVASLEKEHAAVADRVESFSKESVDQIKGQIQQIEEKMASTDPTDTGTTQALKDVLASFQESLAEATDSKKERIANTQLSRLDRQLRTGRELLDGLNTETAPQLAPADVDTLVADAAVPASAERLINLSMLQPDSLSVEAATKLIEDKTNALTDDQRNHLRTFTAARLAENQLSSLGSVSQEVLVGSNKNVGIAQYKVRIANAIASNNQAVANRQVELLSKFADDHAQKLKVAREAMKEGMGTQIRKTKTAWEVVPDGQEMTKAALRKNGGLEMNSARLVQDIATETTALKAAVAEMKSATSLKFGVQSVSSDAKTIPAVNITTQENVEDKARPVVPTEPTPAPASPKPLSKFEEGRLRHEKQDAIVEAAKAALAKRASERQQKQQQAKEEVVSETKEASAEQQDVVSEANPSPVAEAVLPDSKVTTSEVAPDKTKGNLSLYTKVSDKAASVAYKARNLVADYFTQDQGKDGTLRPLAAVQDFVSAYKADPKIVEQYLAKKMTPEQTALVSAFMASASAWAPKITASLTRIGNKDFRFNDMAQFFITEDGAVDMDENVKTAISYAAFQAMIDMYAAGRINSDATINGILGKDENMLVDPAARSLLAEAGTLEKALKNGWGQAAVAALGLKTTSDAPVNLMPALEAAMGAHVHKLLMELGVIERVVVSKAVMDEFSSTSKKGEVRGDASKVQIQFARLVRDEAHNPKVLVQKIFDTNKGTQSVLSKLFSVESNFIEPTTEPVPFTQERAGGRKMEVPSTLAAIVSEANKAEHRLNAELFNYVLGQVTPEIAMEMAGEKVVTDNMHKSRRLGVQAKNDGLRREYDRLMEFVKGTLGDKLDTPIFFQHDVWVQQRVGIKTNMINPQTSKLQRHMLYRPSWETTVQLNDTVGMENFLLRVAEGLGVKTDKNNRAASLDKVHAILQTKEIKGAVKVLSKARDMTGLSENDQAVLAAGVKAGGENFHSLSVLMAMANYTQAYKNGATEFKTQLMAEVDGVTNGPMLSHLLMGAASSVAGLFGLLNRGGFYQQGTASNQYNVWRSVAGHMDLYETTTRNVLDNAKQLLADAEINNADLAAVYHFTGTLEDANGVVDKAGRNIIKTPLTAMVFGSSVASAVDSMADKFVEGVYAKIEDLVEKPEGKAALLTNLNTLGVRWSTDMTVQQMLDQEFNNKEVKALKNALKSTLGQAVAITMKQDFEQFLNQRTQFNQTAQLTFDLYNAAYQAERESLINELVASGEIAVNGKGKPIHDLNKAQERTVRERVKALAPVLHTAMSKDSDNINAGLMMAKGERTFSDDAVYQNEVHFGTEVKGTGAKSSNVAAYKTDDVAPGVAMAPLSVHSFDSLISHYAAAQGDVLNIHDAHGTGLGQIQDAARNLNQAVWKGALNYSPAQEMTNALLRTVRGLASTYKGKIPAPVLANMASALVDFAQKQEANPQGILSVTAVQAQDMATRADDMKLVALSQMGYIDQYAIEGGNYEVTADDRSTAASLRSALVVGLSAGDQNILNGIEDQLDKAIAAELAKRDGLVTPVDIEVDKQQASVSTVAELGKSTIKSDPNLVKAFEQTPVMGLKQAVELLRGSLKSDFSQKLLSALGKATGSDISIRYVTAATMPSELLEQGGDKSRGWYVSKDGQHQIYVLSPEFKHSGLTGELLLHELTHAALARVIEQAQAEGKGPAFELVTELNELLSKASEYAKANGIDEKFAPALANVHEFISWGMTNADFQNNVLMKFEHASTTTENKLVSAMKAFIANITSMLFGKPNINMMNGMTVLVQNVSGLLVAAAQNNKPTQSVNVVLNQVNNGPAIRDLTTTDIYNALAQNNSGNTISAAFDTKLQGLLAGIVERLHGPVGSFKEAVMSQTTVAPETVFAEAMVSGIAPMAFSALGAGFAFTEQEAFVAEQVHATMLEAMENKNGITSVAYRELAKLYAEVRSKVTPADFATGTTPTEVAEGKALYNYIFEVTQDASGRSDYLARFAAMGMAHEGFNTIMQMATSISNRDTTGMSFNDRLNKIFEMVMNWFTGKMTNTVDGQNADAKLTALVTQLVRIEERKRAVLKLKSDVLNPVETVANDLGKAGKEKLEAFGKLPFFKNSTNGLVRLAGSFTSAYAGDRVDAMMEGFNRLRDQHFRTQQGIAAALVNEFRGSNSSNLAFHFLLRASKHLEGIRKDIITNTGKIILRSFDNNGMDLTKAQKSGISAVFLRTDMSSLLDHYSMAELASLVKDKQKVQNEIQRLESTLSNKYRVFYSNASKVLGFYKATGKVTDAHMLMNASNIAKLYGTAYQNKVTVAEATAATAIIDPLVSLYAISYSKDVHIQAAQQVFEAEQARTDGGNGVEVLLRTHKDLQDRSKKQLFSGAETLQMKGYTSEIYDPYMAVVVADETDGKLLMLQGYTQGAPVDTDMADPNATVKHIYHLRDGGLKHQLTGVFSYTGMRAKGSRVHNGNVSPLSFTGQQNIADMATIQARKSKAVNAMFSNRSFDPTTVQETHMAPVLNANGDVVNYRYLMTENVKDKLLDRDNRPDKILGTLAGQIFDKVSSVDQNRKAVAALHEQYKQEFAERPESYMTVGPKSTDPQLREIWAMLPETTKKAVKEIWGTEGMKVRNDLLDINFGYRKLSIADAFQKDEQERNFVEKMFVQVMTYAFDEKAGLRVRQGEDIWQAVVKATKANLVVKSWSTMSGNLRSNWSQLFLMGVSPAKILEHHRVAFKGAWSYRKDSEELFNLQHQLDTGYLQPGQNVSDIKHQIARLEDALQRNPVKPLIDAGLMPTIVEDVAADDDIYSYKSRFVKKVDELTAGVNPHVLGVAREALMLEGSHTFRTMSYATQISDFLARYTLYQVKTEKGMSHLDAIQLASDAFINYDVPTHRMVQYANDSGLVMFTKYYMRIQKMLAKIYKESPGRVMALLAAEAMIGAQPTVLDSSMITRWGNPLNLGALDYPGSLSALTTVRIISSPFTGSGGNPAE